MLPVLKDLKHIAGSPEISILQPEFSPDGRFLAYVSDESGWWQLYLHDLENGDHRQLTSTEAEHAEPAWVQERRTFSFSSDGHRIYFIRNQAAVHSLWQVDLDSGMESRLPLDGSYTHLEQPSSDPQGQLAVIASGGATPLRVAIIEPEGKERVVRRATAEDLPATAYLAPQPFTWAGMDGAEVYGLFYSPKSERFESNGQPPLVISVIFRSAQRAALAREITLNASTCPDQPNLAGDFGYIYEAEKNALRNAVATGVIANFIFAGRKIGWSGPYCSYIMQFGKAAMPFVPNDHFVLLETFDPVEVTGFREVSDRVRIAEVRFRTVPTPFAELGLHPVDPASPLQGTATFVRYDDGWRIEEVD